MRYHRRRSHGRVSTHLRRHRRRGCGVANRVVSFAIPFPVQAAWARRLDPLNLRSGAGAAACSFPSTTQRPTAAEAPRLRHPRNRWTVASSGKVTRVRRKRNTAATAPLLQSRRPRKGAWRRACKAARSSMRVRAARTRRPTSLAPSATSCISECHRSHRARCFNMQLVSLHTLLFGD